MCLRSSIRGHSSGGARTLCQLGKRSSRSERRFAGAAALAVCYRRPVAKPPLPPVLEGFGKKNEGAVAAYGEQLGSLDLDNLDAGDPVDSQPAQPSPELDDQVDGDMPELEDLPELEPPPARSESESNARPNLEPVGDDAHPPQNRRMPTQPPSSLALVLDDDRPPNQSEPARPRPQAGRVPPPTLGPRHSPAPVRRGLFSSDRITNFLACTAVGLLLTIFPAKKFARSYEVSTVEPLLSELDSSIAQPIAVLTDQVEKPEAIMAKIEDGRKKARRRYLMVWLLVGVPLGVGLGFLPRPGD